MQNMNYFGHPIGGNMVKRLNFISGTNPLNNCFALCYFPNAVIKSSKNSFLNFFKSSGSAYKTEIIYDYI